MTDETRPIPSDPDVPRYQGRPVFGAEDGAASPAVAGGGPTDDPFARREAARHRNTLVLVAVAAVVCVVGAVIALASLTGGQDPQAQPGGASGGAGGGAVTTTAPAAGGEDLVVFRSPSGNIGCALSSASARCDIAEKSWELPPAPESCQGDWGVGVFVEGAEAGLVCATDTVLGEGEELAYGATLERGAFRCTSSQEGMRCENTSTGRGFTVARAAYTTF